MNPSKVYTLLTWWNLKSSANMLSFKIKFVAVVKMRDSLGRVDFGTALPHNAFSHNKTFASDPEAGMSWKR
jgi:hypothetical protein